MNTRFTDASNYEKFRTYDEQAHFYYMVCNLHLNDDELFCTKPKKWRVRVFARGMHPDKGGSTKHCHLLEAFFGEVKDDEDHRRDIVDIVKTRITMGNFSWQTSPPTPPPAPTPPTPPPTPPAPKPPKLNRVGDVAVRYKACYDAAVDKVRGLHHCELTEAGIALLYARLAKRCKLESSIATYHMATQRKLFAIITSRVNNVAKYRGQYGLEAVNDADIEAVLMI